MSDVAKRLVQLLECAGSTKTQVARATGISNSAMTNYTKGDMPKAPQLMQLARYFGVSMEWLLTGEEVIVDENCTDVHPVTLSEKIEEAPGDYRLPPPSHLRDLADEVQSLSVELTTLALRIRKAINEEDAR